MKFSLLYKEPEAGLISDVRYDLSVDRLTDILTDSEKHKNYFTGVLCRPLTNIDNIAYRREVIADLTANPELLDSAKTIFSRYDKLKNDWLELRGGVYAADTSAGSSDRSDLLLEYTYDSLKITSIFPKNIVSFYYSICEMLDEFDVRSEAFNSIRSYCREMIDNESLAEIAKIAALFQYNTAEDFEFGLSTVFNDGLELSEADIFSIAPLNEKNVKGILSLIKKKKHKEDDGSLAVPDEDESVEDGRFVLSEALYRIDAALTAITDRIYDTFYGISSELLFYETALAYIDTLNNTGLPSVLPEMKEADYSCFKAKTLYDAFLVFSGCKDPVPNDISFEKDKAGMIIKGKNNTGKTTFLRSVGTAQLLAQAGLPVPAESAVISVRSFIGTHFSSGEEEFKAGDRSGRFESEVKEVAALVDKIRPDSLILLNETFQTTSYDEGSEGMNAILALFSAISAQYIYVTHMTELYDSVDPRTAVKAVSDEGYKIAVRNKQEVNK